jgi:L-fuconolactonase
MLRIDAHQHFWKYDPVRDSWIDEDMIAIRKDFGPGDLHPLLEETALDGCISVQADQSPAETAYLLKHAEAHPFIKGVVGWVNLQADDIEEQLAHYSGFPQLKGFRHVLQGEAERDFMLRPAFQRGIGLLNRYGFTYDILIYADQLPFATEFARRFPDQPMVLDHMAKPDIKGNAAGKTGGLHAWKQGIRSLASCDNVWCKVSGMMTEADWKNWKPEDFKPFLNEVVEAFGPQRLMFGSDWPVCLLAASYEDTARVIQDYFAPFSKDEKNALFGGVATAFYTLT